MAVIYSGVDTTTNQPIAAKTLLPAYQGNAHRRARFRREAEVMKAVQHPNTVELVDFVDGRRGTWILMERLEGETLRDKLANEGAFNPKTINEWLAQVCAALEHMHTLGYVHLDLTPQNLFLTHGGDVKLIDFGIAQRAYMPPKREGDKILGTATYISPEHGSGGDVTPASDVYALGCVVFELLTGKQVFSEHGQLENDATISMRQNTVPAPPTSVAPELNLPMWVDTVIVRALQTDPSERYPSVTAFAEEFNALANPPLFGFSWPGRKKQERATSVRPAEVFSPETSAPVPHVSEVREPTRAGRWVRRELRNARRVLLVFALLVAMIFAVPMIGGSVFSDWLFSTIPAANTEVIDGNWYMRAGPTTSSEIRTLMQQGQPVRITGSPAIVNDEMWWPVSTEVAGERIHGWAHDDGLERTWLMNRSAGWESTKETWSGRWDSLLDALPG